MQPIKILIVEDDSDFVAILKEKLSWSKGFCFVLENAPNLASGLSCLRESRVDAILLDLNLKDSKGLDTLKRLQAEAKSLPIIVLTGEYDESTGPEAIKLGAQDYFVKGKIEPSALTRSISYSIERKQHEQSLRRAYNEIKQLLDLIPSLLIRIDPKEKILYWNDGAEKTFNIPWKGAYGKSLSECGIDWDYEVLKKGIIDCQFKCRSSASIGHGEAILSL